MGLQDFSAYFQQHCKFRLKSGKEIYGVIWKEDSAQHPQYYFASSNEYKRYLKSEHIKKMSYCISLDEVINAEPVLS